MNYIADAKTKYFENKEHYLAMRKAWAEAVNNPDIHLTGAHFMFYNAIRGKDICCGFSDRTNWKKIYHQGWINPGADEASWRLRSWARGDMGSIWMVFGEILDTDVARQVIADMPSIPQKINYTSKSYDDWCDEQMAKEMKKPIKISDLCWNADIETACNNALRKSATLISAGEFKGEVK